MNIRNILKAAWFTPGLNGRMGLNLLLEGPPGSGKTSELRQEADALGFFAFAEMGRRQYEAIIASIRAPQDFAGLPIPTKDGSVEMRAFGWATRVAAQPRGVVLLDELNTAPPAVQPAILRVVLEGVVGDLELPAGVRFVAAMNKTADAAGGWDLAPPLANRFGHIRWEAPSVDAWSDWLLGGDHWFLGGSGSAKTQRQPAFDAAAEEARVMRAFPEPFARASGLVAGFLRARRELLHKQPPEGHPDASKAWPSPRTWEMAVHALAGAEVHGLPAADTDELVAAFVGTGPAGELIEYARKAELPNPADVLDGTVKFTPDARLDRTAAVLMGCAALVTPIDAAKRQKRAAALWKLLDEVGEKSADLTVAPVRAVAKAAQGQPKEHDLTRLAEAADVILRLEPMLKAAGMMRK